MRLLVTTALKGKPLPTAGSDQQGSISGKKPDQLTSLAQGENIWHNTFIFCEMLEGKHITGSANPRLRLVDDEQHSSSLAMLLHRFQIAWWKH